MDEPTSALPTPKWDGCSASSTTRARGVATYISHKMDEVFRLGPHYRARGRHIATRERGATEPGEVIRLMVGRELAALHLDEKHTCGDELMQVDGLCLPHADRPGSWQLQRVGFTLHAGEILGVAGLLGAGRTELLECLFGAHRLRATEGRVWIDGKLINIRSPADALRRRMALVTEDRKGLGLFADMTVAENITLCHLDQLRTLGMLNLRRERATVRRGRSFRHQDGEHRGADLEP